LQLSALAPAGSIGPSAYGFTLVGNAVDAVRQGGPAEKAGLLAGDMILEVDHQGVGEAGVREDPSLAETRVSELLHAGASRHSLRVQRGTQMLELTIVAATPARGP
jgi:S1-C subfamily serine protease